MWGPALWQAMFSSAWWCTEENREVLRRFLFEELPWLLPCELCRSNHAKHLPVLRRRLGEPGSREDFLYWLYSMKHMVNRSLKPPRPSPSYEDVLAKLEFHHGLVDDVQLADALVLVALNARALNRDDLYLAACVSLSRLLPLPEDSQLLRTLRNPTRPVLQHAFHASRAARAERGLPCLPLSHYRKCSEL